MLILFFESSTSALLRIGRISILLAIGDGGWVESGRKYGWLGLVGSPKNGPMYVSAPT